jgi:hypothetical protein
MDSYWNVHRSLKAIALNIIRASEHKKRKKPDFGGENALCHNSGVPKDLPIGYGVTLIRDISAKLDYLVSPNCDTYRSAMYHHLQGPVIHKKGTNSKNRM